MPDEILRIMGPYHNRLLVVIVDGPKPKPGQVPHRAAKILIEHGWRPYTGPARSKAGWIVHDGTDPNLRPQSTRVR